MGSRQDQLANILGASVSSSHVSFPRQQDVMGTPYEDEIQRMYELLGGQLDRFEINFRKWDMTLDGLAVELDEQLHFNRYRLTTLRSTLYEKLPSFPYAEYCHYSAVHEQDCLRAGSYGGKWSNPSCERQFGPAGPHGDLSGLGAPRWKQRAFYDFVKDLSTLVIGVEVVRLSVWDELEIDGSTATLGKLLDDPRHSTPAFESRVIELVDARRSTIH